MRRALLAAALATVSLAPSSCAPPSPEAEEPTLDQVRAATGKYRDVEVALAEGYQRDPMDVCETPYHMGLTEVSGVMGIHFVKRDLLGVDEHHTRLDVMGTHTDFTRPAVLVYEPQADGSLELVALENLVSAEAWRAAGNGDPPSFQGVAFEYRSDDPAMTIRAHWDLHLWLFRDNPSGTFASYNPNASCEHHEFHMPMMHR